MQRAFWKNSITQIIMNEHTLQQLDKKRKLKTITKYKEKKLKQ